MIESGSARVTVERVLSTLSNGCIFSGRQSDGELVRVKVSGMELRPEIGQSYEITGFIKIYVDKYKNSVTQYDVKKVTRLQTVGALLIPFLEQLPNIGPMRAKRLLEEFGDDLAEVLTNPARLGDVANALDPKKPILAAKIAAQVFAAMTYKCEEEHSAKSEVAFLTLLENAGVANNRAARQLWRLVGGEGSRNRLLKNPYLAASIMNWAVADHLGLKLLKQACPGDVMDHPHRLLGAVDSCWRELLAEGNSASEEESVDARRKLTR